MHSIVRCETGVEGPDSRHTAVEPYQFSCIHRMASSSLNCLSNSYSCRASTDMLAEDGVAGFRSRCSDKTILGCGGVVCLVGFRADLNSHRSARCQTRSAVRGLLASGGTFILCRLRLRPLHQTGGIWVLPPGGLRPLFSIMWSVLRSSNRK